MKRVDDSIVDYSSGPQGILVPSTKEIQSFQLIDVSWILVIEKEVCALTHVYHPAYIAKATFRTLAGTQYWKASLAGKGIIITVRLALLYHAAL